MNQSLHPKYRADIDGLRAVAVLSVVGYHAFPGLIRGGFVGVDIFFVISGYLISTIILANLERQRFSFLDFYGRRIKRIFPALLVVLSACLVAGWYVLLAIEYQQLGKHIAGGAAFASNLVLWSESGYFDNAAATKPLLHLWSLGIEEQFYLLWPLLLWLCWKSRFRPLHAILAVGLVSFAVNIRLVHHDAVAAFYSPLPRFWELALGSCLAYATLFQPRRLERLRKIDCNLYAAAGTALLAVSIFLISADRAFPGWWALLPTVGTVLIIAAGPGSWLGRVLFSNRLLVWFGLISYPLYLWHWPLLAFARIVGADGGTPPPVIRIVIVVISILLAWLTYVLVERPVRFRSVSAATPIVLLAAMTVCGSLGLAAFARDGIADRSVAFRGGAEDFVDTHQYPEAENCRFSFFSRANAPDKCSTNTEQPEILLIGDSHAGHYYKGLTSSHLKVAVIWNGGCYPGSQFGSCRAKEAAVEDYIDAHKSTLRVVLLAGYLNLYENDRLLNGDRNPDYEKLRVEAGALDGADGVAQRVYRDYTRLIEKINGDGLAVAIVADVPELVKNVSGCRFLHQCAQRVATARVRDTQKRARALFNRIMAEHPGVGLFDPVPSLCDSQYCYSEVQGRLMYWDDNHLNENGSRLIGAKLVDWLASRYPVSRGDAH